jgi:hypothetical protein
VVCLDLEVTADMPDPMSGMLRIQGPRGRQAGGSVDNCKEDRRKKLIEGHHLKKAVVQELRE